MKAICSVCKREFTKKKSNQKYCSVECASKNRERPARYNKYGDAEIPKYQEFDLKVGDIIKAEDNNKDDKRLYKFRVTKIYTHFFEAERLDTGVIRSFTKGARICREVKKED